VLPQRSPLLPLAQGASEKQFEEAAMAGASDARLHGFCMEGMQHWWSSCGTVAATMYDAARTISAIYLEGQLLDLKYSLSIVSIIKCNIQDPGKFHVDLANGRQQYTESSF
jgi:hypothetical protein